MPVLIGIDYGLRRTGIAVSDARGRLALAVGTHVEGRDGSLVARLRELCDTHGATELVIGLPLGLSGRQGAMAARVQRFAALLRQKLGLPITLVDERLSSREAAAWIAMRGRPARRGELDAVAAQIILQTYLDRSHAATTEELP